MTRLLFVFLALVGAACTRPEAPPPPAPATEPPAAAPPPVPAIPAPLVWAAEPETRLRTLAGADTALLVFTRLDVLGADTLGLRVRCARCAQPLEGWVRPEQVVWRAVAPVDAASHSLAEFALAVRDAAVRRDLPALRAVMDPLFTYSFGGPPGPDAALAFWQQQAQRPLDQLVALLDRGLLSRWDDEPTAGRDPLWVAPPDYLRQPEYLGWRAGFRQSGGRWSWVFLVAGD